MKQFHGGCLECTSQEKYGIRRCNGCQYKTANWSLPDLSINIDHSCSKDLYQTIRNIPQHIEDERGLRAQLELLTLVSKKLGLTKSEKFLNELTKIEED